MISHTLRSLLYAGKTLALAHLFATYGFSVGAGYGPSMLPTFLVTSPADPEWFVTSKRYRRGRGLRVGDCAVFAIPVEPGDEGVKRVLGMPGDYVLLNSPPPSPLSSSSPSSSSETQMIGGEEEETGTETKTETEARTKGKAAENMIQVPRGHCYLAGDNLPWSRDSRDYGPVPLGLVRGKVVAKIAFRGWAPWDWFERIPNNLSKVPATTTTTI